MILDAVQRVVLSDGVSLPLGDVGLQEVAPADKPDEDHAAHIVRDAVAHASERWGRPSPLRLLQHPNQHSPARPILLAGDQEFAARPPARRAARARL